MKTLLFLLGVFTSLSSFAQGPSLTDPHGILTGSGKLFTVKMIPADKQMKVFVVGNKAADVRITDLGLEAYVKVGNEFKPITLKRSEQYYVLPEELKPNSDLRFDVKSSKDKESIFIKTSK